MTRTKRRFKDFWNFIRKQGFCWVLYFTFTWIVPLLLINEKFIFYNTESHMVVLTTIGLIVSIILLFAFRKFLWKKTTAMKPSVFKWMLLTLHRAIPYGLIVTGCAVVLAHADTIQDLLLQIGISLIIGTVFEFVYILQQKARDIEKLNNDVDERINLAREADGR